MAQLNLLDLIDEPAAAPSTGPLVVSYGLGVDSTAVLVGLRDRGTRPDLILFADTGSEKQETYDYLPVIQEWLEGVGFPPVTVVTNRVKDFKHWPPYHTLGENCLTNGTLPSLAFGFKSCSLKWKVAPQNKFTKNWAPAQAAWRRGEKVRKVIGYDDGPKDRRRYAQAIGIEDPAYEYWYPLLDWHWDRDACKGVIRGAGLPVPPKSACYFCPATQPEELHEHRKVYLRFIVLMEARAAPRLEKIEGLWRNGVKGTRGGKKRPGKMTEYIREHGLLPGAEIDDIAARAPLELLDNQKAFATGAEIPEWHDFLEAFTPETATDEIGCGAHRVPRLIDLGTDRVTTDPVARTEQ